MYRKIMVALAVCSISAIAVSAAQAVEVDAVKVPPPGKYKFTIDGAKSTITIGGCDPAKWGPNTVLPGTIKVPKPKGPAKVNIPGAGIKDNLPVVNLPKGCAFGINGWFQGEATGGHDYKHAPGDWNAVLKTSGAGTFNVVFNSKAELESAVFARTDCEIGETKPDPSIGFTEDQANKNSINLNLGGKYKPAGTNTWSINVTNTSASMPYDFKTIAPLLNQENCNIVTASMQIEELLGIVPVTNHMVITAVKQ